jgi:RimJ/RimL family protein N-acetyltransferase
MSNSKPIEPEGQLVSADPALLPDAQASILVGSDVTIVALTEEYVEGLYTNLGGPQNAHIYRYLPVQPPNDIDDFRKIVKDLIKPHFFPFAVLSNSRVFASNSTASHSAQPTPVALLSYLNIVPQNRTIEIGWITFGPTLQRTRASTEVFYLLLKHAFDDLGYRRVEWKANALNLPSRRAALRLGFVFEGIFRKHSIVKGRNRDTFWASIIDDEWPPVKLALEKWLEESNFDSEGKQKKKLEDIREELRTTKEI